MANCYRGEVDLLIGDESHVLCLTLEGLARLESDLGAQSLSALIAMLAEVRAGTIVPVLTEALVGGGQMDRAAAAALLAQASPPLRLAQAYTALVRATFSEPDA
ncbi:MAG: gene transfer agent family protein [Devosiaceae bacterium]|nr:gene transfer agent family protein [Devosiaceae bacterium MH13]